MHCARTWLGAAAATALLGVSVACARRRKEVNDATATRSNMYDWGPGAAATTLFTGVRLRDVLQRVGARVGEQVGAGEL